ncbi:DUF3331 domain-containing protein [Burkholderia territorii]|uniref:DUF3331 domain-containing protein n=1 Tax=Burkholderia territorii TaxID=1503055 RepID=UPI0039BEEF5C
MKCPARTEKRHAALVSIEIQAPGSVLVSWSDPTRCRYDEQRWIAPKSRKSGWCAISGLEVCIGDLIFRPQFRGQYRPANVDEMILADEVERIANLRLDH